MIKINQDIHAIRVELKEDFARLETSIAEFRNETKQEFVSIAGKFNQLNWMMGALLMGMFRLLFKIFLQV